MHRVRRVALRAGHEGPIAADHIGTAVKCGRVLPIRLGELMTRPATSGGCVRPRDRATLPAGSLVADLAPSAHGTRCGAAVRAAAMGDDPAALSKAWAPAAQNRCAVWRVNAMPVSHGAMTTTTCVTTLTVRRCWWHERACARVAIVGTRDATRAAGATELACDASIRIVSSTRRVDAAAHSGAVAASGGASPVAVVGSGLDPALPTCGPRSVRPGGSCSSTHSARRSGWHLRRARTASIHGWPMSWSWSSPTNTGAQGHGDTGVGSQPLVPRTNAHSR